LDVTVASFLKAAGNAGKGDAQLPHSICENAEPFAVEVVWRGLACAFELPPGSGEEFTARVTWRLAVRLEVAFNVAIETF
jgi:hypothetical protein